jgi:lipoyl(octanoyl) transferase
MNHAVYVTPQPKLAPYLKTYEKMKAYSQQRHADDPDLIWLVQHPPVFTLGLAANPQHRLHPSAIPMIQVDRGGQITYHGPGQLILYPLLNLKRLKCSMIDLVNALEQSTLDVLNHFNLTGTTNQQARGVYLNDAKIAALGLKITRSCSYHGLAINITNNLKPFTHINPCGYPKQPITRLADYVPTITVHQVAKIVTQKLCLHLNLTPYCTSTLDHPTRYTPPKTSLNQAHDSA